MTDYHEVVGHGGLLFNEHPVASGLPFIWSSDDSKIFGPD